ncbi:sensor histidine kinase [Bilifractor sp. HCP3S3_D3]|uniref:sensor histidine kinase n=2 Tax=unclassified Bilifractor TaxID=2815795 RepID=UPI003F8CCC74
MYISWMVLGVLLGLLVAEEVRNWRNGNLLQKMHQQMNEERKKVGLSSIPFKTQRVWNSSDSLRRMNVALSELFDIEEKMRRSSLEQELMTEKMRFTQLQNQINPHFLYNTLENIRARAIIDDNLIVADMTEALSQYFRYNISKGNDIVTLSEELNNIRLYMKIQRFRFADRMSFQLFIHDDGGIADHCQIPKMTLQPIVENAIFHGLENKREKGTVTIHVEFTDAHVVIWVTDDGVGMSPLQLKNLRISLSRNPLYSVYTHRGGGGIALKNVNNRLKLLYGNECGIVVNSTEGVGTQVRLEIPLILKDGIRHE